MYIVTSQPTPYKFIMKVEEEMWNDKIKTLKRDIYWSLCNPWRNKFVIAYIF
jgi:hypothetical protein